MPLTVRPRIRRGFRLALRRRDLTDAEIDEELRFHVEMRVAQLMARGLTRDQADAEARRRFGESWEDAVSRMHEAGQLREERLAMRERLDALWSDVKYAARTLARQRGFALVVIATFALGIGANATMFGVIDRLLLRPPPHIARPGEIMQVGVVVREDGKETFVDVHPYPLYRIVAADTVVFRDAAVVSRSNKYTLGRGAEAEQIFGALVNAGYFAAFGTRPALGRFFLAEDESTASRVVVLSHGFWRRRFAGDRNVLGKSLHIGPGYYTVVGVAPEGFTGVHPERVDAWIPLVSAESLRFARGDWANNWGGGWLQIYARVRPGTSEEAAAAHLGTSYAAAFAAWNATSDRPLGAQRTEIALRSILPAEQLEDNAEANVSRLLMAVAALILLMGCANIANLLLARGTERRREIAVRLTLGVSRARLVRLLLAETALLALAGGAAALVLSTWGVRLIHATLLESFVWTDAGVDWRAIGVTGILVVVTVALAGLAPAVGATRPNLSGALKAGGREGSVQHSRVRAALLIVQAALSVLLLVGAGLFVASLREVASLRLGYEPSRVIAATMDLGALEYENADQLAVFQAMAERVTAVPGVESATLSYTHPLHGWATGFGVSVPGRDSLPQSPAGGPYFNSVGADYFRTLDLTLVEGRPITAEDVRVGARVAVLSEPMARAYWPGEPAVGRCITLEDEFPCTRVVGVAAGARERVEAEAGRFLIYVPTRAEWHAAPKVLLARARTDDPSRLVEPIRRTMQSVAPNLPYAEVRPLEELLARQIRPWRTGATLFTMFGGLAVLLAAVGLYSAVSFSVAQRRHEFGVRSALGAQARDIVRLVLGQGMRAAAVGVMLGLVTALLAGGFVADLLFQTSPRNPAVFASVAALILLVAVAASFVPAWRAARVDPVRALRGE